MSESLFVPHYTLITAPRITPVRWMLVLHGILGSSTNFRSFARRVTEICPSWGFVLVDLRMHGLSQNAQPPHTVSSTADDLVRLGERLALPIAGVMGHSFGGKVAIAYGQRRMGELDQVWILDASPGTNGRRLSDVHSVLQFLHSIPQPLSSRERFFEIARERGISLRTAEWLAMNIRRMDDGFRLRLNLEAIDALLADYFATDMWSVVEQPFARELHFVIGGRSDAIDASDRARLAALAPRVRSHVLDGAAHWVHIDAPDALIELVSAYLDGA